MDSSLILLESQTGIGERQIERLEQPPDLSFQIVHQSFILHMVNAARQRLIKMIHQLHIGAVELPQIFQAGSEIRSEEHTSELQSLMRISYAVFCLKKKNNTIS